MENLKKVIFSMSKVGKVIPGRKQILKNIHLSFFYGAKIGVLGLNGSGKSTLLRIIAGVDPDYLGEVHWNKGISIGYLPQEPILDPNLTVKQVVEQAVAPQIALMKEFEEVNMRFGDELSEKEMNTLLERQAQLQDELDAKNVWDLDSRLELAMDSLSCPPSDALIGVLSGGEKRRVALCRLLLEEPDILLLDEPTNHLDAQTVYWLEQFLHNYKGTVIAVTHDRYFLDNVAGWILELDRGEGIPWEGNYSSWLEQKKNRLAVEEKQESKRQKMLSSELEWIRSSPKARHAKSKARITNYQEMLSVSKEKRNETNDLFIPSGPRLGDKVIEAQNLTMAYGDKLLFENVNFKLPPGGIIGVIGANGAGKSTLFKLLVGQIQPTAGSITLGDTVKLAYVDQQRELEADKSILQVVSGGNDIIEVGNNTINARAYISRFNFSGEDQSKLVKNLSGGERNRVHLACMLKEGGNVLLLDEPSNDLDVNTLRALENAIMNFAGCAVVISHDRFFLDRIVTHMLAFEGNGNVVWFDGNCSQYEEDRLKRLGESAAQPHRLTYKKFTRS